MNGARAIRRLPYRARCWTAAAASPSTAPSSCLPTIPENGPQSRFIGTARPDQQGRFTIRGLPPGRYVAIAVGYLQPGEERDPDALEAWRKGATRLTLSEGETHALDLKLSAF